MDIMDASIRSIYFIEIIIFRSISSMYNYNSTSIFQINYKQELLYDQNSETELLAHFPPKFVSLIIDSFIRSFLISPSHLLQFNTLPPHPYTPTLTYTRTQPNHPRKRRKCVQNKQQQPRGSQRCTRVLARESGVYPLATYIYIHSGSPS